MGANNSLLYIRVNWESFHAFRTRRAFMAYTGKSISTVNIVGWCLDIQNSPYDTAITACSVDFGIGLRHCQYMIEHLSFSWNAVLCHFLNHVIKILWRFERRLDLFPLESRLVWPQPIDSMEYNRYIVIDFDQAVSATWYSYTDVKSYSRTKTLVRQAIAIPIVHTTTRYDNICNSRSSFISELLVTDRNGRQCSNKVTGRQCGLPRVHAGVGISEIIWLISSHKRKRPSSPWACRPTQFERRHYGHSLHSLLSICYPTIVSAYR